MQVLKTGELARAGGVGKLLVGSVQVYYAVRCVQHFEWLTEPSLSSGVWIFVGLALWLFSACVNLGWSRVRAWGLKPLWAVLAIALLAAGWDALQTGNPWGPTVARFLLAVTVYTHLHMGVSHVLAAVLGLRGCEMRVIPYLVTRLWRGGEAAELCLCPGFWTPVDRWEARLRNAGAP